MQIWGSAVCDDGRMYLASTSDDTATSRAHRMTPERWCTVVYGKDLA